MAGIVGDLVLAERLGQLEDAPVGDAAHNAAAVENDAAGSLGDSVMSARERRRSVDCAYRYMGNRGGFCGVQGVQEKAGESGGVLFDFVDLARPDLSIVLALVFMEYPGGREWQRTIPINSYSMSAAEVDEIARVCSSNNPSQESRERRPRRRSAAGLGFSFLRSGMGLVTFQHEPPGSSSLLKLSPNARLITTLRVFLSTTTHTTETMAARSSIARAARQLTSVARPARPFICRNAPAAPWSKQSFRPFSASAAGEFWPKAPRRQR